VLKTNKTLTVLNLSENAMLKGERVWHYQHAAPGSAIEGPFTTAQMMSDRDRGVDRKIKGLTLIWEGYYKPATPSTVMEMFGKQWRQTAFDGTSDYSDTPEGAAALADGLKSNSTVQELNVSSNRLDQSSKDALTKAKPPQLLELQLD
jgi:hypothetical protein